VSVTAPRRVAIDVVSDVVCPWCFIGRRRLAKALVLRPDVAADVTWRPFQLDPTIPAGGISRRDYLLQKFGSEERVAALQARLAEAGEAEGIPFRFDLIERSPNTRDAHRLIRWAHAADLQDKVVENLFAAYFLHGSDIGDADVLAELADDAGLDAAMIRERLDSFADMQEVADEIAAAMRLGISGVPCFIFDARLGLSGAQPPQALAEAMDKVLSEGGEPPADNVTPPSGAG
jgi:predicted DsbA family dithiol-disulfide isomerase